MMHHVRVPSIAAPEGEIPRWDAWLTTKAAGASRLRFESGALRAHDVESEAVVDQARANARFAHEARR